MEWLVALEMESNKGTHKFTIGSCSILADKGMTVSLIACQVKLQTLMSRLETKERCICGTVDQVASEQLISFDCFILDASLHGQAPR